MPIVLNDVTNTEKLSLINSNFQKIEDAINDSLLWRNGSEAGEAQMERPLDMNNGQILNALVGGLRLSNLAEDLTASVVSAANSAISASTSEANASASATSAGSSATSASSSASSAASSAASISASAAQIATNTSNISSLQTRMSAEEAKVNSVALGGTGASTAATARSNLGAAASGANTDITSITGSAASLTTGRTLQVDLTSAATPSFNGTANAVIGTTGTLPVTKGGTGGTTAATARTGIGAAASGANTDITSITGSAATLTTARTIQTNLGSTSAASFNGSANVSPGVTGTLPIVNGGTGATDASGARTAFGVNYTKTTTSTEQTFYYDNGMQATHQVVAAGSISAGASSAFTWTYPQAFAQVPFADIRLVTSQSTQVVIGVETCTTTQITGFILNSSGSAVTPTLQLFAYGTRI